MCVLELHKIEVGKVFKDDNNMNRINEVTPILVIMDNGCVFHWLYIVGVCQNLL